jgi:aminoglycoside phosphotransferase (APT) family kinase protein
MHPPLPLTVPVGRSARRPQWADLPPAVRGRLEVGLGSKVVEAHSQDSGFTPGFASRLRLADGRRLFVKAADDQRDWLVSSYRDEAAKRRLIPDAVPAPALQQVIDEPVGDRGWVLLVFDDVEGRPPGRPWRLDEARSALRTAVALAELLTPPPTGWAWGALADVFFPDQPDWASLIGREGWTAHLDDLVELAERRGELLAGNTLGHSDLRDDNLILTNDGRFSVCDWNWPTVGPRWADAVCLAISIYGDGLDAEALLTETALFGPEDRDAVDCLLAVLTGYLLLWSAKPRSPTSPYLRAHQAWYAEATGAWLKERRGWR